MPSRTGVCLSTIAVAAAALTTAALQPHVSAAPPVLDEYSSMVITRVQQILDGDRITDVMAEIDAAHEVWQAGHKSALWDLYKAKHRVEISGGAEVAGTPQAQLQYSQLASVRLADVFGKQYVVETGARPIYSEIEGALQGFMQDAIDDHNAASATKWPCRVFLTVDSGYNPVFACIPATVTGWQSNVTVNVDLRAKAMKGMLRKVPRAHRSSLFPVFIVDKLPGGVEKSGGTTGKGEVSNWSGVAHENNTKVPYEFVSLVVPKSGNAFSRGIVGLTRESVTKVGDNHDAGTADGGWAYTMIHESGHAIDYMLGLTRHPADPTQPAKPDDLQGVLYAGSANAPIGERAPEAYMRWILKKTWICNSIKQKDATEEDKAKQAVCTAKAKEYLKAQPAFTKFNITP